MKNILKLFPSPATTLLLFITPIVFTIYFVVTKFSDQFITNQQITYFDVQHSWAGTFFVTQTWLDWFNRFMDFALWGMFASIVLILYWFVVSAKTAVSNHQIEENFENFKEEKKAWHQKFFITAIIKVILVIMMVITFFSIVGQSIPLLAINISSAIQEFQPAVILSIAYSVLLIVFLQFLFLTCLKTFRLIRTDE